VPTSGRAGWGSNRNPAVTRRRPPEISADTDSL